ncbi:7371_t:CDS:2, partial [Paraglomus occultum]
INQNTPNLYLKISLFYYSTPLEFFRHIFPTHRKRAKDKYLNALNTAMNQTNDHKCLDKLENMKKSVNEARILRDWEKWMHEKAAISVCHSICKINLDLHEVINTEAKSKDVLPEEEECSEEVDKESKEQDANVNNPDLEHDIDEDIEDVAEKTAFVLNIFQESIIITASSADKKLADIF